MAAQVPLVLEVKVTNQDSELVSGDTGMVFGGMTCHIWFDLGGLRYTTQPQTIGQAGYCRILGYCSQSAWGAIESRHLPSEVIQGHLGKETCTKGHVTQMLGVYILRCSPGHVTQMLGVYIIRCTPGHVTPILGVYILRCTPGHVTPMLFVYIYQIYITSATCTILHLITIEDIWGKRRMTPILYNCH